MKYPLLNILFVALSLTLASGSLYAQCANVIDTGEIWCCNHSKILASATV